MNTAQHIHVRMDMNPETAESLGFLWWKDVIYDEEAPPGVMDDIIMLEQQGYVFGLPAAPNGEDTNFVGVYKKI